jgi:hypothetical protein
MSRASSMPATAAMIAAARASPRIGATSAANFASSRRPCSSMSAAGMPESWRAVKRSPVSVRISTSVSVCGQPDWKSVVTRSRSATSAGSFAVSSV